MDLGFLTLDLYFYYCVLHDFITSLPHLLPYLLPYFIESLITKAGVIKLPYIPALLNNKCITQKKTIQVWQMHF